MKGLLVKSFRTAFAPTTAMLLIVQVSCSAPALPAEYERAQAAELRGDYEEALDGYVESSKRAKRKKDRLMARFRAAGVLNAMERREEAIAAYLETAEMGVAIKGSQQADSLAARSLYRAGCIAYDHLGQANPEQKVRALELWWRTMKEHPDALAADEALERVVGHERRVSSSKNMASLVKKLWALFRMHREKDIADNLLWTLGEIYEKDFESAEHAVRIYEKLALREPSGPLTDDACFKTAALHRQLGNPLRSLVFYRKILETVKHSWVFRSFTSPYAPKAQLEIGIVGLNELNEPERAIRAFRRLVEKFPTSILRDNALWWIALSELRMGNIAGARRTHRELVRRFPQSRFTYQLDALIDWAPAARAIAGEDRENLCRLLKDHRQKHPFGWFRKHREDLFEKNGCPGEL